MTILVNIDLEGSNETLRSALGAETTMVVRSLDDARRHLEAFPDEDTVVVGSGIDLGLTLGFAQELRLSRPFLGVILVRRRIDTSVLADSLRAGVREVVEERDLAGLNDAVARAQQLATAMRQQAGLPVEPLTESQHGTVVTVFSAKGGCGKTTLSTNLAAALADGGRRQVCLVDLDLAFGDVAIALQLFPAHTISDAVPLASRLDAEAVEGLLTPHSPGLTALVAPLEPGAAEAIPADLVKRIIDILRNRYDYVVIDTPPAFDDQVLAAFDSSDVIALIATLDIPALKNLKLTIETLELLNYPRERWKVVMNRADSKVGLSLAEVEKTLKAPITVQIPSSRDVPASINRGVPIVLDDAKHAVSQAIRGFGEKHVLTAATSAVPTIPAELRNDRRRLLRRRSRTA